MATSQNNLMTSFPAGFSAGLMVRGMPILQTQTGNVFWVDNGPLLPNVPGIAAGSDGSSTITLNSTPGKGTYNRPFASIAQALKLCGQGNGDVIFLKPGHRE